MKIASCHHSWAVWLFDKMWADWLRFSGYAFQYRAPLGKFSAFVVSMSCDQASAKKGTPDDSFSSIFKRYASELNHAIFTAVEQRREVGAFETQDNKNFIVNILFTFTKQPCVESPSTKEFLKYHTDIPLSKLNSICNLLPVFPHARQCSISGSIPLFC